MVAREWLLRGTHGAADQLAAAPSAAKSMQQLAAEAPMFSSNVQPRGNLFCCMSRQSNKQPTCMLCVREASTLGTACSRATSGTGLPEAGRLGTGGRKTPVPELLPELPSLSPEPACSPGRAMGDTRCCCHAGAAKALPAPAGGACCPCRLPRLRLPRCPALLVVASRRLHSTAKIPWYDAGLDMNRREADQAGPDAH